MTDERIAEIEARLAKATPGPWEWKHSYHLTKPDDNGEYERVRHITAGSDDNTVAVMDSDWLSCEADAEVIANAPSDLRYLLDIVSLEPSTDMCPEECGWLPQRQHAASCSATTGIEGVTNEEVDAFLAERAAPPREDGLTFENADEAIKYLSSEYVAAKDGEITRLRTALEHLSYWAEDDGVRVFARDALATTTQDSRDDRS